MDVVGFNGLLTELADAKKGRECISTLKNMELQRVQPNEATLAALGTLRDAKKRDFLACVGLMKVMIRDFEKHSKIKY